MNQQSIFTGKLIALSEGLPIPLTYADARQVAESIYHELESIDKFFPRYYEVNGLTSILSAAMYESAPRHFTLDSWYWQLFCALRDHARQLDNAVQNGAYHARLVNEIVSAENPITWSEYLETIPVVVADGQGVVLHCSEYSNYGYIVVRGAVFQAYGFHMFNLYNRFAAIRYNWNNLPE